MHPPSTRNRALLQGRTWGAIALGCLMVATLSCRRAPEEAAVSAPAETPSTPSVVESTPSPTASPTASPDTPTATAPNAVTPPPPLPAECNDPPTQLAMNRCAEAEYAQADARLNQVYQAVKSDLSGSQEDALIAAEKAWIDFRDGNCAFEQAQYAGGSIQPTVYYGCLTTSTLDRIDRLQGPTTTNLSYAAADAALNDTYQALKGMLSPADQDLLTTAQLAWLDYRDRHCAYVDGGSDACLAAITAARTDELENQLEARSL